MNREDLIRRLIDDCAPVRPLAHPAWRALVWFGASLCYLALVVHFVGRRPELFVTIADPRYSAEVAAMFLTSAMAAAGAFCAGCPGRAIWERSAPVPFLLIWIGALALGCWRDRHIPGLASYANIACLRTIAAMSIPSALVILSMVRRGAPIAPATTVGLAALAATSMAAAVYRLSFEQDMAQSAGFCPFVAVLAMSGLASLFGRRLLRWTTRDELVAAVQRGR
jgi:hypothetical protein